MRMVEFFFQNACENVFIYEILYEIISLFVIVNSWELCCFILNVSENLSSFMKF